VKSEITEAWTWFGLSAAAGFALGAAGGRILGPAIRMAVEIGGTRILRHAFELAFDAGSRHGGSKQAAAGEYAAGEYAGYAAERSY
jgi:hypothetical protein